MDFFALNVWVSGGWGMGKSQLERARKMAFGWKELGACKEPGGFGIERQDRELT